MRQHAGEPRGADQPRAQVLVAVGVRAPLRAGVVEVDHPQPVKADRAVERRDHRVDAGGLVHRRSRRPRGGPRRGSRRTGRARRPSPRPPPRPAASSSIARARSRTRRPSRSRGRAVTPGAPSSTVSSTRHRPSANRRIPASTPAPRCEPEVDVDDRGAPCIGDTQLVGEDRHAPVEDVRLGGREVDEVWRVHDERRDPRGREPLAEGRQLAREGRTPAPRRRVVGEHLDRVHADLGGPVRGPQHAVAQGEVGAEAPAVREHWPEAYRSGGRPPPRLAAWMRTCWRGFGPSSTPTGCGSSRGSAPGRRRWTTSRWSSGSPSRRSPARSTC